MPEASTTRRGINPSRFMGASFAAGSALEEKVDNNSRKITLLKNIIRTRKENVDKQLASGTGLDQSIQNIASTVTSISETLKARHKFEMSQARDAAQEDENKRRSLKERFGESFKGITKVAQKVLAPVKNIFDQIIGWIGKLLFAKVALSIFDWLSDKKNTDKVKSIVRFFKDWWPVLLAGYIAFATPFIPFTIAMVAGLKTFLIGLGSSLVLLKGAMLTLGPWAKAAAVVGIAGLSAWALTRGQGESGDGNTEKKNQGGLIPGRGPNKDSVSTMLTPGEFVMSRDAVDTWGVNTLEGMNAAAGGKNTGSPSRGFNEGGQVSDANLNKKGYSEGGAQWHNTGKEDHFGSDKKEFRFKGPKNEAYFLQIPRQNPNQIEIWNEEFGQDRWVGNLDKQTKLMTFSDRFWGKGARDFERDYFSKDANKSMVLRRANDLMTGKVTLDKNTMFEAKVRSSGKEISLGPNTAAKFMSDLSKEQRREGLQSLFNGGNTGGDKIPDINPAEKISEKKMKVLGLVI